MTKPTISSTAKLPVVSELSSKHDEVGDERQTMLARDLSP